MWDPTEHIRDLMAVGHTHEEAVAETRAYAARRREIQRQATKEAAKRRERTEERPPMFLTHESRAQRRRKREVTNQRGEQS